ncbi:PPE domain-containing protein [Amycolatopsis sp. H20-H5]|uniref:PPE domain-containing protein n=1 Tax=Amycolatopsis sp. H20-H5 TaxID=3046309 RepID=UPI002DB5735E|nr:PPE domain-containing protein [Amycolatopsis sp. H20-H5]MEC3976722.1 PPE domain-containing protein [Amycolatopsis sp. H20-H5]
MSDHHRRDKTKRVKRIQARNETEAAFGTIHWDGYQHRELWDMVKSAEPAVLGEHAHRWAELAKGVDTATADVRTTVQKLLLSWRGPSAVQAAESVHRLTDWASDAGEQARHIGDGMDVYTAALTEARRSMPEPVHYYAERWFRDGRAVTALNGQSGAYMMDELLDDKLPGKQQMDDAKARAVRVMEQYEDASKGVRHRLPPMFGTAPQVTARVPDEPPRAVVVVPIGGPLPGDPDPRDRAPGPVPQPGPSPVAGRPGYDDGTYAASAVPGELSGVGGQAGSGVNGLNGGGVPGAADALDDGARSGRGFGGGPAAGGFGPGQAGGARAGMGGFGMMPPGAGARREDDEEHHDRYAVGHDLLDDLPPAYPPVFGE